MDLFLEVTVVSIVPLCSTDASCSVLSGQYARACILRRRAPGLQGEPSRSHCPVQSSPSRAGYLLTAPGLRAGAGPGAGAGAGAAAASPGMHSSAANR